MKMIDVTIPVLILTVIAMLFIGETEINNQFPYIHIESPLKIIGCILIAFGISCFYYQGKQDAQKDNIKQNIEQINTYIKN